VLAASGIALSRVAGLVRERFLAQALGQGDAADALRAALRLPNLVQNLLGDAALSASFAPVYSQLLARGEHGLALALRRRALARLGLVVSLLVALGIGLAPWLVSVVAPGFGPERAPLTVLLVRILFPATGLLVMSSLALAVLQGHGRLLSGHVAPVIWNASIIVALLGWQTLVPGAAAGELATVIAWGAVVGAALQWAWQGHHVRNLHPVPGDAAGAGPVDADALARSWQRCLEAVPAVLLSRGVLQISAWIDTALASLLPLGSLAVLGYAQTLCLLPIALFGTSMAAAALPVLSGAVTREAAGREDFERILALGARRLCLLGLLATGAGVFFAPAIVRLVYAGGAFDEAAVDNTAFALACGMSIVLPSLFGRLWASACFALSRPAAATRAACLRVTLSALLSLLAVLSFADREAGAWAVGYLLLASGIAALLECWLLARTLVRASALRSPWPRAWRTSLLALLAGSVAGWATAAAAPAGVFADLGVLAAYGTGFLLVAFAAGHPDARHLLRRTAPQSGRAAD
jgi:putative peptidoglycan lipid II flippase